MQRLRHVLMPVVAVGLVVSGSVVYAQARNRGPLGQIVVTGGTSKNNSDTATPFDLAAYQKVSVQSPDSGVWVSFDGAPTCITNFPCIFLPPDVLLDDTVRLRVDAGVPAGGLIAIQCPSGVSTCVLNVFDNQANQ